MRTPLNKSFMPSKKGKENAAVVANTEKGEKTMNNEFQKIIDRAAEVGKTRPEVKAKLEQGIAAAQAARAAAEQAKGTAETEEDFYQSCDDEFHAREKETFLRQQLDRLEETTSMNETEYDRYIAIVSDAVEKTASDFCKVAEKAMGEIIAAGEKYYDIITDADKTLESLDAGAFVLQVKYAYRVFNFHNAPSLKLKIPDEWRFHALRYRTGISPQSFSLLETLGSDNVTRAWRMYLETRDN